MPGVMWGGTTDAYATATGLTGLDTSIGAFSLGLWFKARGEALVGDIWFHGIVGTNRECVIVGDPSVPLGALRLFTADASAGSSAVSGAGFVLGRQWAHYAVVWNGARVCFFRNAVLHSTAALTRVPTINGTRTTKIGYAGLAGVPSSPMFDVQVFPNVILTPGEVRALMDPRKNTAGCTGRYFRYWRPLNSGLLVDESGNNNNLTLSSTSLGHSQSEEPPWREAVGAAPFSRARLRYPMWLKGAPAAGASIAAPFGRSRLTPPWSRPGRRFGFYE